MKTKVIGQTGRTVLSDELGRYYSSRKRTVRYQYIKVPHGFIAWICGGFHSRTYGACGFGTTKKNAKTSLRKNLARNYGYIGNMLFSDVDESDTVGVVNWRLLDDNAISRTKTQHELCGEYGH